MQVYGPKVLYLINHVNRQVWHNIEERWRVAHFELAKSLWDELFHAWQLSFIDNLLCDEVEEGTKACDDHLHIFWVDSPNHNWEENREHDVAVMYVEAS